MKCDKCNRVKLCTTIGGVRLCHLCTVRLILILSEWKDFDIAAEAKHFVGKEHVE